MVGNGSLDRLRETLPAKRAFQRIARRCEIEAFGRRQAADDFGLRNILAPREKSIEDFMRQRLRRIRPRFNQRVEQPGRKMRRYAKLTHVAPGDPRRRAPTPAAPLARHAKG